MIDSKDISVIVQGAIDKKETKKCLNSIRKFLPKAQIILSTWKGSDINDLNYDILVLNDDPGALPNLNCSQNINRQIYSTQQGLKKADRKYAFKFRSDLILTNNTFLEYFDKFQNRSEEYILFKRKILASAHGAKYSKKNRPIELFHPSDWYYFGLREDLEEYFLETKLVKREDFDYWVDKGFSPEQYICYCCFARNFKNNSLEDFCAWSEEHIDISSKFLINNFIFLENKQSGIYLKKYIYSKNEKYEGEIYLNLYNFYTFESEYKEICDKDYKITSNKLFLDKNVLKFYRFAYKAFNPNAPTLSRITRLISLPFGFCFMIFKLIEGFLKKII